MHHLELCFPHVFKENQENDAQHRGTGGRRREGDKSTRLNTEEKMNEEGRMFG